MIKWLLGLLIAFLIIDHLWVHLGGPFVERLRGEYREEIKSMVKEGQEVKLAQSHRQSIIDQLIQKVRSLLKKEESKEESG